MRCAIVYAPPADTPLMRTASAWLRRDAYTGAAIEGPIEGLTERDHAFITALPRRLGFHARLKSPFALAAGRSLGELDRQLRHFCAPLAPLTVSLKLALLGDAFALTLPRRDADLDMLAARVVTEFDGFRQAEAEDKVVRSAEMTLNARQLSNLMMWGEPDVFDQFRFQMLLTGPIERRERGHVERVIARHFRDVADTPLDVTQLCLAVAPEPFAPYLVHSACVFGAKPSRKIA